jgi:CMP-N-acetylneuraminic acid synthetase
MYEDKRILAIIPARGGSKGIKNKNIYPIKGKPLLAYTVEAALKSRFIDYVMVSTDSEAIAEAARSCGAQIPFMRPKELAGDKSRTIDAIVDAIEKLRVQGEVFDTLVLLQPTSPLRDSSDIDGALELFYREKEMSLLSVTEVSENPILYRKMEGNRLFPILNQSSTVRRQDFDKYYRVNGAIYINAVKEITPETSFNDNKIGFIMPAEKSVDIDSMEDIDRVIGLLT